MNSFRTEIFPEKSPFYVDYHKKMLFMGSCFTENIGNKLLENKFPALVNPFGVLYNPFSVQKAIELIIHNKKFSNNNLNFENDKWFSFYHHSSFSSPNKKDILNNINDKIDKSHHFLKETQLLFITFGTSWYYKLIKTGEIVANCHKLPANLFDRKLLDIEQIVSSWQKLIKQLKEFNPDLKIIFTVSPIRHWKDGAVNNRLSKSILIVAIHEVLKKFEHLSYFPSYEIMMDDLRDYRFYADDFLHLNSQAINYIWDKFKSAFIDEGTMQISKRVQKIVKAVNHRPFHPQTKGYKEFLESHLRKLEQMNIQYPFINFSKEKLHFANELEKL